MYAEVRIANHGDKFIGQFIYRHYTDGSESAAIFLSGTCCSHTPEDYEHILEHELVELHAARACYEEGLRSWNPKGFNEVYYKVIDNLGRFR